MEESGGRVLRNNYKGHMDKTKGSMEAREGDGDGWSCGGVVGVNVDNCN